MRKKFAALQKDIEDHKEEILSLFESKKQLYAQINNLEKDIVGLKKEINEVWGGGWSEDLWEDFLLRYWCWFV